MTDDCMDSVSAEVVCGAGLGRTRNMRITVSLPDSDVAYLDEYARRHRLGSRSAAVCEAIQALCRELGAKSG